MPRWLPLLWTVAWEAHLLLELPSTPSGCSLLRDQNPRAEVGWEFENDPEPDARYHRGDTSGPVSQTVCPIVYGAPNQRPF